MYVSAYLYVCVLIPVYMCPLTSVYAQVLPGRDIPADRVLDALTGTLVVSADTKVC
jgi:hypothetical protein